MKKLFIIVLTIHFFFLESIAQNVKDVDALYADFSIPDASAFTLLGVNPNKVTKPSSTKELSASLLNIASSYKTISPGFAIEWAPFMTFDKRTVDGAHIDRSYDEFRKNFFKRNIQLSSASIKDSQGTKFALGINFAVYDKTDPSYNKSYVEKIFLLTNTSLTDLNSFSKANNVFINNRDSFFAKINVLGDPIYANLIPSPIALGNTLLSDAQKNVIKQTFRSNLGSRYVEKVDDQLNEVLNTYNVVFNTLEAFRRSDDKALEKILKEQRTIFKKENWNAGVLKFGFGNIWNSPNDSWKNLASQKFTSYGVWAFKVAKFGQGILLAQYNYNNTNDSLNKTQFLLGGRFLAGSANVHGSLESVWQGNTYREIKGQKKDNDKTLRSTLGVEFKINEGLWFEFAVGISGPSKDFFKKASMLSFGNVKYTFGKEKPRFDIPY